MQGSSLPRAGARAAIHVEKGVHKWFTYSFPRKSKLWERAQKDNAPVLLVWVKGYLQPGVQQRR